MRKGIVLLAVTLLLAPGLVTAQEDTEDPAPDPSGDTGLVLREPVVVNAAAVAQTEQGLRGSIATISISVAENGSGHIFMDTLPLTQVDMQGSARLAIQVAGVITGLDVNEYDFFIVVRSNSQIIGGPSAGAIMTAGVVAALKEWTVDRQVMMTGTVNPDGSIGPVGGVPEKAAAAADTGATLFLYPEGQEAAARSGGIVDMDEYCENELYITCRAVADVETAVTYVTGHEFDRPPLTGEVTDAEFKRAMQPLASELFANASEDVASARERFDAATDLPAQVRESLASSLADAETALDEADRTLAEERYYTTASKSFQAAITGRFMHHALGLYEAEDRGAYVDDVFARAQEVVDAAAAEARNAEVATPTGLQAVGAAQVRASEAEQRLDAARAARSEAQGQQDVLGVLHAIAYAEERAATVTWWLRIGSAFPEGELRLEQADLERAAEQSITNAEESLTYAEVILQESGAIGRELPNARETLAQARADHDAGYYASAMFKAVEAEVRGNLVLELLGYEGEVPDRKVESARENARRAILEARERGAEPLLAVAYYEFGGDVPEPVQRLEFYHLARTIARLTQYLGVTPAEPNPSRFVGDAGRPPVTPVIPLTHGGAYFAIGLGLGVLGTAVMALARGSATERRTRRDDTPPGPVFPWGATPPPPPPLPHWQRDAFHEGPPRHPSGYEENL